MQVSSRIINKRGFVRKSSLLRAITYLCTIKVIGCGAKFKTKSNFRILDQERDRTKRIFPKIANHKKICHNSYYSRLISFFKEAEPDLIRLLAYELISTEDDVSIVLARKLKLNHDLDLLTVFPAISSRRR